MSNATDQTIRDAVEILARGFRVDTRGRQTSQVRTAARRYCFAELGRREVYSYGRHFPLFRFVPRTASGARRDLFVINGDVWRGSRTSGTAGHQTEARNAIAASGVDSVIIPFSALDGAGIEIDSIRPVASRPEVWSDEIRTARDLTQVPRGFQTVRYDVEMTAETLDDIPETYRTTYREMTAAELTARRAELDAPDYPGYPGSFPLLPDADGLYRWKQSRTRQITPDADGLYRWTVHIHRLGDCVFSGIRTETFTRPAAPFEVSRTSTRETVSLVARDASGRTRGYCSAEDRTSCESGPGAACIHCGAPLFANVTVRRRSRFLSSFDTNESPPLYFLAELPARGAGCDTVDAALDRLAPRAVHAARARGLDVPRQGDVFFIETQLTDADLLPRTVSRARLTQWSRDARARSGEVCYLPKMTAAERRRMDGFARKEFRRRFRQVLADAESGNVDANADRRERSRALWAETRTRHAAERAAVDAAGLDATAPESSACSNCGAGIGAECDYGARTGRAHYQRESIDARHASEIRTLRGRGRDSYRAPVGPDTPRGGRRRYYRFALDHSARVDSKRESLRRAAFGGPCPLYLARAQVTRYAHASRYQWESSAIVRERAAIAERARRARSELDAEVKRGPHETRQDVRDAYRGRFGTNAAAVLRQARIAARERFDASYIETGAQWANRRETVRRALLVYGTAHTATEVVRTRGGATYVRGTVSHRPELETGPARDADHRPLILESGRWYLAVRNTVPRQNRRRVSRTARA